MLIHPRGRGDDALLGALRWNATEPGHTIVAVDVPPMTGPEALEDVIEDLSACPGVLRLIPARKNGGSIPGAGDWLARHLGRPVIAPEGRAVAVPGGGLYISPGEGAGWLRFDPGGENLQHSRRFPRPSWDCAQLSERHGLVGRSAVDPLPSGAWIRPDGDSPDVLAFRNWLIGSIAPHPMLPRLVLGYPGSPLPPVAAVAQFVGTLPGLLQAAVRLAGFGGTGDGLTAFGQELADTLDVPVVLGDGVQISPLSPNGESEMRTVLRRGVMAWPPFASDLGYLPARSTGGIPARPVIVGHRAPVAGLPELEPGVYDYGHGAVLEVTQSGLWMRPPTPPTDSAVVRAEQADVAHVKIVYDASTGESALRMSSLASEMIERLEPQVRSAAKILASTEITAGRRMAAAAPWAVPEGTQHTADVASLAESWAAPGTGIKLEAEISPVAGTETAVAAGTWEMGISAPPVRTPWMAQPSAEVEGTDPAAGRAEPVLEGSPKAPAVPAAMPVAPAVALYALPMSQFDAHGAVQQADLVGRTVASDAEVPSARAASRSVSAPSTAVGAAALSEAAVDLESTVTFERVVFTEAHPKSPSPIPVAEVFGLSAGTTGAPPPAQLAATSPPPVTREPRPGRPGFRVQPVPGPECRVDPREGDLKKDRDWLRRNLSKEHDAAASTVARILSEHPGLRAGDGASDADALTDLVAVRLYLSGTIQGLDDEVRAAKAGPHLALARCVASGLRRLPSYRGPLWTRAPLADEEGRWYGSVSSLTEWSFLPALTSARRELPGSAEFLIWSMSARRADLIDPSWSGQVVFLPGTSFKVLSVSEGAAGREVRLRELTAAEKATAEVTPGDSGRNMTALDEYAVTALEESRQAWQESDFAQELTEARRNRFRSAPGLLADPAAADTVPWQRVSEE